MNFRANARRGARVSVLGGSLLALVACGDGQGLNFDFDPDLRGLGRGFSTADAARSASSPRPNADARGIISYTDYQVAVAQKGDTLTSLASRVGLSANELARYNGLEPGATLREGEIIALPERVSADNVDVTTLAGNALDRVDSTQQSQATPQPQATPKRHQVSSGETAYSISRLYGVSVRSLAEWNSLDSALTVRKGQFLLIPTAAQQATTASNSDTTPGVGTPTPLPPSSSAPLPSAPAQSANEAKADTPEQPNMAQDRSAASNAAMSMPADGRVVGAYVKGSSDGIDIGAPAGSAVRAAQAGTVAAITRDTDQVPILVLRHEGNLLTVYAGIDNISVNKGDSVSRGQTIAKVRKSDTPALHFQVRKGTASVDPMDYLN
ncbi:MAG TPA: peptidase M23 [Maritimibacter sp.]|nr:peptidase M23 [Maritimibacter sp.]